MTIPTSLSSDYRIATSREIRSWSFGVLTATRHPSATSYDNVRGTLHDQRIFGPVDDFKCACGKYRGDRYRGMVYDHCGVKIAPNTTRGSRFGHIEFPDPIGHPFAPTSELQCFPVLPILFIQSPGGRLLPTLYDQLIEASNNHATSKIQETITSIVAHLTSVVVTAHRWRLAASRTLARGLALECRHSHC
ncbi:MAG: hypothetical protein JXB62_03290 [Pirellulales bacterium]|nr:hypothetical protein [Pirellulales bacterium]